MGSDAAHRSQAAQTGGRHQATVVRLVLVRDALCSVPSVLFKKVVQCRTNAAASAASDPENGYFKHRMATIRSQITAYYFGAFQQHTHALDGLSFYQQVLYFT